MNYYAIILAAGKGTRMKSELPKVLHKVADQPMVQHVINNVKQASIEDVILVVGHKAELVQQELGNQASYVLQEQQLGTGHAVLMAQDLLANKEGVTLVLCGDTPLISSKTLQDMIFYHEKTGSAATILTASLDNPTGYGRIIRNEEGHVTKIVEQKDANEEEKQVNEINSGMYCFDNQKLWNVLTKITNENTQGEYYLTDCIELLVQKQEQVSAFLTSDVNEIMGINDPEALKKANTLFTV